MSKTSHPKQFIDILGIGTTLIQSTFHRFEGICPSENVYVVTSELYKDFVKQQLPMLGEHQILCEPMRRNTAPCIAYATYKIASQDPDANIVVAPSDHIILKEGVFREIIKKALEATAKHDVLLTLGITPNRPDTGYGYIQFDDLSESPFGKEIKKVKTFTEKPQLELAKSFLASGDFLWNSGIFIWNQKTILQAFEKHLPDVNDIFREGASFYNTDEEAGFIAKAYSLVKNISIDYGIMEKASNVFVLAADFGWSDLGTWGSLYEIRPKDTQGNTVIGNSVRIYDSSNCIINMPSGKPVVIQGLDGYIIAEEDNCLLICRRQDEQEIRKYVSDIRLHFGEQYV